jgi:CRISPR-associated protein Cmr6
MSALPLYREARASRISLRAAGAQWSGHPGLWYEKFFDRWQDDRFGEIAEGGKQDWISTVVGSNQRAGVPSLIAEHHRRRTALVEESLGGFMVPLTLQSPLVTGLGYEHPIENGFLWHPVLGTPYLPGSSVKGLLRAWAAIWTKMEKEIGQILGGVGEGIGTWIVFDALPVEPVRLACEVMTPHDGGWRIRTDGRTTPSDWVSPNPIPFLVVAQPARFSFAFAPRRGAEIPEGRGRESWVRESRETVERWLRDALDCIGIGGKTAVGFGRFI